MFVKSLKALFKVQRSVFNLIWRWPLLDMNDIYIYIVFCANKKSLIGHIESNFSYNNKWICFFYMIIHTKLNIYKKQ